MTSRGSPYLRASSIHVRLTKRGQATAGDATCTACCRCLRSNGEQANFDGTLLPLIGKQEQANFDGTPHLASNVTRPGGEQHVGMIDLLFGVREKFAAMRMAYPHAQARLGVTRERSGKDEAHTIGVCGRWERARDLGIQRRHGMTRRGLQMPCRYCRRAKL